MQRGSVLHVLETVLTRKSHLCQFCDVFPDIRYFLFLCDLGIFISLKGREMDWDILWFAGSFQKWLQHQAMGHPKPGAGDSGQVSHMNGRDSVSLDGHWRELEWQEEPGLWPRYCSVKFRYPKWQLGQTPVSAKKLSTALRLEIWVGQYCFISLILILIAFFLCIFKVSISSFPIM